MTSRGLPPRSLIRLAFAACLATTLSAGQEPVDRAMVERIRQEGTTRSKAGAYFDHFVTVIGPRLTGTPAHKAAADWAREQLAAAGLSDSHLEPFDFGRGWELTGFTLEMTSPRYMPLIGYLQGQDNVGPLFDAWLEPFKAMGARKNVVDRIGNTDHLSFTAVGLPGFNPIQDYVDYDVRTHRTNMDTPERVREEDLRQAAIVFASFAWQAATREARIPRPPAPAAAPR